jgi:diguanylate cyclase (GGDEF)-like protein/PAS domain S-box-containing protein
MLDQKEVQKRIPLLIATALLLIILSIISFGIVVVFKMNSLQANFQQVYTHATFVSKAGLEAHVALTKTHNLMLGIILQKDTALAKEQAKKILTLDNNLRKYIQLVKSEFNGLAKNTSQIEHLLDQWKDIRRQLLSLMQNGRRDQAIKMASSKSFDIYRELEQDLDDIVVLNQKYIDSLEKAAKEQTADIIFFVKLYLLILAISSIFFVTVVMGKVRNILVLGNLGAKKLHENEERMKLALSGADEATWDLDIPTGKVNFDSQWGRILGYTRASERPHFFNDWVKLIHEEDKPRVLKAMSDHVEGLLPEYKAEYRIRSSIGTIKWVAGHGKAVSRDRAGKALRIVGITRDITKKKQAEETMWMMAHTDYLTGLPNRAMLYDRLKQSIANAKRHDKKLAVLFMDLDGFKVINDQFGHDAGDELLREVAKRAENIIRVEDTVARTGGDEFIFILNEVSGRENIAVVAEKIIAAIAEPFIIQENRCMIGCSIGIAIFPDDGVDKEHLMTKSDNAMYEAKTKGKGNFQFSKNT